MQCKYSVQYQGAHVPSAEMRSAIEKTVSPDEHKDLKTSRCHPHAIHATQHQQQWCWGEKKGGKNGRLAYLNMHIPTWNGKRQWWWEGSRAWAMAVVATTRWWWREKGKGHAWTCTHLPKTASVSAGKKGAECRQWWRWLRQQDDDGERKARGVLEPVRTYQKRQVLVLGRMEQKTSNNGGDSDDNMMVVERKASLGHVWTYMHLPKVASISAGQNSVEHRQW